MPSGPHSLGPGRRPAARRVHLPRWANARVLVAVAALSLALVGGWLAVRDIGLVAVERVEVSGAGGAQADAIQAALTDAGRTMTTLHVRDDVLRESVARYPVVKALETSVAPPHTLRVRVVEHTAVATLDSGQGEAVAVAADGTLLPGVVASALPALTTRSATTGDQVRDRRTRRTIRLLAAAPAPLRAKTATAFLGPRGLTAHLADGPSVVFGTGARLRAKWASLTAVLASDGARGATSIDVRVPEFPAAAGLEQASTQLGQPSTGN